MRIDLEVHLLTGVSIGLTHQSTDQGEQNITFDLIVLRFIVGLVPESPLTVKDWPQSKGREHF